VLGIYFEFGFWDLGFLQPLSDKHEFVTLLQAQFINKLTLME
jgi:hypothetical protein